MIWYFHWFQNRKEQKAKVVVNITRKNGRKLPSMFWHSIESPAFSGFKFVSMVELKQTSSMVAILYAVTLGNPSKTMKDSIPYLSKRTYGENVTHEQDYQRLIVLFISSKLDQVRSCHCRYHPLLSAYCFLLPRRWLEHRCCRVLFVSFPQIILKVEPDSQTESSKDQPLN